MTETKHDDRQKALKNRTTPLRAMHLESNRVCEWPRSSALKREVRHSGLLY